MSTLYDPGLSRIKAKVNKIVRLSSSDSRVKVFQAYEMPF